MFCDEVLELIEPIAAGDLTPDGRIAAHLASCSGCAAVLASAQRVEQLLHTRAVPDPPAQFTTRTLARVRRDRWRREQFFDAAFNTALVVVVLVVIGGGWFLIDRTGLSAIGRDTVALFSSGVSSFAGRIGASLPLYAGAAALIGTTLGLWWWAERDATF
jgi:predicted anti-sigma-YlaC factor YlaD